MGAFSRQESKLQAIAIKVRRAKIKARGNHPDMKLKHPDWCRDANKGDYTQLTKFITDECKKKQLKQQRFLEKLHAKD